MSSQSSAPGQTHAVSAKAVWYAVVTAGIAGFVWGTLLDDVLRQDWKRVAFGIFVACGLSLTAYLMTRAALKSSQLPSS